MPLTLPWERMKERKRAKEGEREREREREKERRKQSSSSDSGAPTTISRESESERAGPCPYLPMYTRSIEQLYDQESIYAMQLVFRGKGHARTIIVGLTMTLWALYAYNSR